MAQGRIEKKERKFIVILLSAIDVAPLSTTGKLGSWNIILHLELHASVFPKPLSSLPVIGKLEILF